ncbi:PRTRC system protein B, partial [Bacteroides uniformis]
ETPCCPPPEDMTFSKLLEYWEKRFWLSEFSHLGGSRNPTGSNLVSVTEKARANPFDENELKPMNKQLKDLLA